MATNKDKIFMISVETPYPVKDIRSFIILTGVTIEKAEYILKSYCKCGITNLRDVMTLAKLGHLTL